MKVSLFIDPNIDMVDFSLDHGADRVELYTGDYAKNYLNNKLDSVINYKKTADYAINNGLEVNAGHDLDLINLQFLKYSIPELYEVSIGHALICNSLYYGLEKTIKMYLDKLKQMTLNFKEHGKGKTIIILHGLLGSLDNWSTIAKSLSYNYNQYSDDFSNLFKDFNSNSFYKLKFVYTFQY